MNKIYKRIDRIRGTGMATLNLEPSSPYYHLKGKRFPVINIDKPDIKCLITLSLDGELVRFTIEEIL